jgi:hypothetical protein
MKKTFRASLLFLATALMLNFSIVSSRSGSTDSQTIFPKGSWNFSAHPYMGEGYKVRPIVVTSVETEARTLSVKAVRVKNISTKAVLAVKLAWTLSDERYPKKILREGETSLITMDKTLASQDNRILKVGVVSFLELYKPFLKPSTLEGNFRLEVGVSQVLFEDQSSWQVGQSVSVVPNFRTRIVKANYSGSAASVVPLIVPDACAKQRCVYDGVPPPSYSSGTSENDEFCTNCGISCCNTICGQVPACDCH